MASKHRPQKKRVLGGRYEIGAALGEGGMAKVFRGTDTVLGRTVAVKVLAPQFAKDKQFVERFRREAQAAAALNHPNVVSVYDTGDQGIVHFIVMEYVEGATLAETIGRDGPLHPERAIEIGEAVGRALGAAHAAGVIHRDVKPGNIMLTKDGEVKVMDFGIARAVSTDSVTQTATVLGTASYLSPEQAQGETVDGRSDIYSLGCVLYELLTGRPPFVGDTPVSVAYKHVNEPPIPPRTLNGDVPPGLEQIVMKSLAKNAANRFQSANELVEDLGRAAAGNTVHATPILDEARTHVMTRPEETQVLRAPEPSYGGGGAGRAVAITIAILSILGVAGFFLARSLLSEAPTVTMPNVIGATEEGALRTLRGLGLRVDVTERFREEEPPNTVFAQDPPEGTRLEEGDTVEISVSRGLRQVEVPTLVGGQESDAAGILEASRLVLGFTSQQPSEDPEGTIIAQDPPAGERVDEGSSVNITVSSGPALTSVPNVICQSREDAQAEIEERDLEYQEVGTSFSEDCPADTIASQDPEAGSEVERGSTVQVVVSEGPEPSPFP
ncbi:MAG: Stk1 family PASTA domain-containing Ser/Thr kinase [Actinomycetota bacterium]